MPTEEEGPVEPYRPIYDIFRRQPVVIKQCAAISLLSHSFRLTRCSRDNHYDRPAFSERPWLGALIFDNEASDARDHCANERTFLSWLRLSVYMAIVSVAIVLSFHLKSEPSEIGACEHAKQA